MKLEEVTNFYIRDAEQNIFPTLSFRTQPRNGIISDWKFVNHFSMKFLKINY